VKAARPKKVIVAPLFPDPFPARDRIICFAENLPASTGNNI
jgi:hypothetical protein